MPAQLTHIAYAKSFLKIHPRYDESAFLHGTTFPDIRRLAGIAWARTHYYYVELEDIEGEADSWTAGLMVHGYFDRLWNRYFANLKLPESNDMSHKLWSAVKIAQETKYCGTFERREELARIFEEPPYPAEIGFGVEPDKLERWYSYIAWKLRTPYSPDARRDYAEEIGFDAEKMDRLLERVEGIRLDSIWQERIARMEKELGC
ncbi:MAG: hypothetical protein NVSMB39_4080 [Candidatus Saccharimonadales bacterium]